VKHLVALGSSFAAGPGLPPYERRAAMRSTRNYAHLLAGEFGARLTDLTVSGATTATLLDEDQRILIVTFPPQVSGVPVDADVVTITAGGNDLNYIGSLAKAALTGWLRKPERAAAPPSVTDHVLQQAVDGLVRVVAAVRRRAPNARILLVDYLTVLGEQTSTSPQTPFTAETIEALRALGDQLVGVFTAAAQGSGAELVRVSAISVDHALGSAQPWVTGFSPRPARLPSVFHPNAAGMAAVADEIRRVLGS
jgi:lysophospholipase L1-like esterase